MAREIGLKFPGHGAPEGLMYVQTAVCYYYILFAQITNYTKYRYPIRRLVITGKDDSENLIALLGSCESIEIKKTIKSIRLDIFIQPAEGSPVFAIARNLKLDVDWPAWTLRPPSVTEVELLRGVGNMKTLIMDIAGARDIRSIPFQQMCADLSPDLGMNWTENDSFPNLSNGMGIMDQGVRPIRLVGRG